MSDSPGQQIPKRNAGQRLVDDLTRPGDPFSITVMIVEAGRIAERLERLHELLSGQRSAWMQVRVNRDQVLEVRVDDAVREARQQTMSLIRLLAEIHKQRAGVPLVPDGDDVLDGL